MIIVYPIDYSVQDMTWDSASYLIETTHSEKSLSAFRKKQAATIPSISLLELTDEMLLMPLSLLV